MERVSAARQSDKMELPRAYPHGREAGRTHNRVDFTDRPLWREEVGARPKGRRRLIMPEGGADDRTSI